MNRKTEELRRRYGELLSTEDIAQVLHYPTAEAVVKAHLRGALPVPLVKFKGRRGWFATAEIVGECLTRFEETLRKGNQR